MGAPSAGSAEDIWPQFVDPPADSRPMMRWWWFGPAISATELDRELRVMKAAGIGGVEVQPVYPLVPDSSISKNLPYLSPGFLAMLRHAAVTAREEGMRIDVTLGSGWPFGGPHIPVDLASSEIRMQRLQIAPAANSVTLPRVDMWEAIEGAFFLPSDHGAAQRLVIADGVAGLPAGHGAGQLLVFIAGRTGQQVKRAAVGAEGFVLDHLSAVAIQRHLADVGEPLLSAFSGLEPPSAVFSDSLEAYGAGWTPDLLREFKRRRGYDLSEHLPELFLELPDSKPVRFDYGRTLSELVDERYLTAIENWARAHGTRFRAQVYGLPPPTLSSNSLVALPEGEGDNWREFTSTRWATSAAHLYDKPVVSSETWTWLHSPAWAATPLDLKMEADRHFLQGVNQLVGHGWPYSAPDAGEPGAAFYAAAALNDHNPWFHVMPDIMRYLQRVSYMLRLGRSVSQVAIYLPTEDVFSRMKPEHTSANDKMQEALGGDLIGQVLDAGQSFDFIDGKAVVGSLDRYKVLILPPAEWIDPVAYANIERWVAKGGIVLATGELPSEAGGRMDQAERQSVRTISRRLEAQSRVRRVSPSAVKSTLGAVVRPQFVVAERQSDVGFVYRQTADSDLFFIVNTSNRPISTRAIAQARFSHPQWWDPVSGKRWDAAGGSIGVSLEPYESRFLIYRKKSSSPLRESEAPRGSVDLSEEWTARKEGTGEGLGTKVLGSWTALPGLANYSGRMVYSRKLSIARNISAGCYSLEFEEGRPRVAGKGDRAQALLDAPVRDAAEIWVNGARVGSIWTAPFRIDLGRSLHPGTNDLQIIVGNTNLNRLAPAPKPDVSLLTARYGARFNLQDQDKVVAQPSGMISPPRLLYRRCGVGER